MSSNSLGILLLCTGVLGLASRAYAADPVPMEPAPTGEAPTPALAEEMPPPEEEEPSYYEDKLLVIGLKLGAAINAFNSLGTAFTPELEIGFLLPPLDEAFEIFLATRWSAPSDEGKNEPDPRLPGDGVATWSVTRSDLSFGLGLRFRIPLEGDFRPYLAAGPRLYLLETEVEGEAGGEPFGKNTETGTAFGFMFQLGGEYHVGPGAILLELAVNGAALDQTILADTNASSFDIYLGYRFFF